MSKEKVGPTPGQQDQLAQVGRVMSELVHDLSNEVTVLHGWALLARGEMDAGRAADAEMQRVLEASAGLGAMLRDVVATVAGQRLSPEVTFDPHARAEAVIAQHVRRASPLTIRLHSSLPPRVAIHGRSSFWDRILANLLGNATRYARHEVDVSLRLEETGTGRHVVLRVEDDGSGVQAQDRENIFRPFWHGLEGVTGLGLGAVAWLTAQLGGEASYADDAGLGGAAFEVRVPVAGVRGGRRREADAVDTGALEGRKVLLVDDDQAVRTAVTRLLCRFGAEVREVNPSGEPEDALMEAIFCAVPEVILLDLRFGVQGGVALWRRLEAVVPRLAERVVFVTGASPGEADWAAAEATGQPVLPKPFDLGLLARTIRQVTGDDR